MRKAQLKAQKQNRFGNDMDIRFFGPSGQRKPTALLWSSVKGCLGVIGPFLHGHDSGTSGLEALKPS